LAGRVQQRFFTGKDRLAFVLHVYHCQISRVLSNTVSPSSPVSFSELFYGDFMRIIAAPNAFKGSMNALEAAEAMKRGILAAVPECEVICVPVADGGDGLTEIMVQALSGALMEKNVKGPRMEACLATFCLTEDLAVIEMARASGLALLAKDQQDPTKTSSYGTGELIAAAMDAGARRIVVGLGGSATCDGGIGMASALGYRFLAKDGRELEPIGGSLPHIDTIDTTRVDKRLSATVFEGICDVTNPLVGENGASFVYSPQKGATVAQVELLDKGLRNLADIVDRQIGIDIRHLPGAGAAGGLGGGLHAFCGAELKKGIDLVMDLVNLKEQLRGADLVLTAEGQIDYQTKFDKAPAGVARAAKEANIPCIAICGSVGEGIEELYEIGLHAVFSLCKGPQSIDSAIKNGAHLLAFAVEQVVRTFVAGKS
jgi:glycerate kinase